MARHRTQSGAAPPAVRPTPKPRPHSPAVPPADWWLHALPAATIAVLAIGLYGPALNGAFVYDDPNAVSQSMLIRTIFPLQRFLAFSTRPLTDFSFAVDFALSGLATWSYHLTNMLLHAANALLLYGIAWATFASTPLVRRYGAVRRDLAWAAAALFAAHPLASEAVAYISSRSEVLAAFWMLLALGSFIVGSTTRRQNLQRAAGACVCGATAAGLASKEIAAATPFALLLYDWLFLRASWQRARQRRVLIGLSFLPLAIGGTFLVLRAYLSPSPMGDYAATAGLGFDRFGRGEYLMTQFGVIVYYLQLVVLPVGQTFDYDWALARSPFALDVVIPFLVLAVIGVLAVRAARTQPLASFAAGWTLLILAPTSSVLPIADLAVERRMYLPLAALMLLAAAWLWDLVQWLPDAWRRRPEWTYRAVVIIPLAALAVLSFQRAWLWGHPIALHEDGVAKASGNPRVRLNLGVTYLNSGETERAYQTLAIAKTLYDKQESVNAFPRIGAFIHYNLGAVLFSRKEPERAEPELRRALELGGQYLALRPMAYMLLSRIAAQRAEWPAAVADLEEALKYQDNPDWRVDLAQMQRRAGDADAARATLQQVLRFNPNHPRATALLEQMNKQ